MLEIALATAGVCLPAADFTDAQIDGIVRHCPRGPSRRPAGNGDVSKSTTGTRGVSAVSVREGAAAGSAASEWRVSSTEAPSRLHGAAGKPPDGADAGCSGGGVIGVPLDKVWRRRRGHATQRCRAAASRRWTWRRRWPRQVRPRRSRWLRL